MNVDDICSRRFFRVNASCTLRDAANYMRLRQVTALLVSDDSTPNRVAGMVTDHDIVVHGVALMEHCQDATVGSVMASGYVTIDHAAAVGNALRSMLAHGVRRLVVIGSRREVMGLLTFDDAIRTFNTDWSYIAGILDRTTGHGEVRGETATLYA